VYGPGAVVRSPSARQFAEFSLEEERMSSHKAVSWARSLLVCVLFTSLACPALGAPALFGDNGHYYEYIPAAVTWDAANAAAQAQSFVGMAGHLATITSQAEQDFIVSVILPPLPTGGSDPWLGGYQDLNDPAYAEPAGAWKWITGEPWDYTSWIPTEPNNYNGYEHHLHIRDSGQYPDLYGLWNDRNSQAHELPYIVEYEVPEPTTLALLAMAAPAVVRLGTRSR
jgi:hypothetical protein